MSRSADWACALALCFAGAAAAQTSAYPGLGRGATPAEVAAWDIDVRPDFKGLPAGSGSVAKGMEIWEARCASCHGVFGESNQFFAPLAGGTTAQDVATGRAARLTDPAYPGRTTLMKLATLSTLWDYINRAMPWNEPKSLATDEVYAVTAYVLNLGGIVGADFTLSDRNMAEVQRRLPNRAGLGTAHALWPGASGLSGQAARKPDASGSACMKNCATQAVVTSSMPDIARNAHGNLAEQTRGVGAQRGIDTARAGGGGGGSAVPGAVPGIPLPVAPGVPAAPTPLALADKYTCTACHAVEGRLVGPGFREIAEKYQGRPDAVAYLAGRVKAGSAGVWGAIAMPAQPSVPDADLQSLARWLAQGAPK